MKLILLFLFQTLSFMVGEVPVKVNAGWVLQHSPVVDSIACYRNGIRQKVGVDFTLNADTISSIYWADSDTLLCDYKYVECPYRGSCK